MGEYYKQAKAQREQFDKQVESNMEVIKDLFLSYVVKMIVKDGAVRFYAETGIYFTLGCPENFPEKVDYRVLIKWCEEEGFYVSKSDGIHKYYGKNNYEPSSFCVTL